MGNVNLKKINSYQGKYLFEVDISGSLHTISLSRDYWLKLSDGTEPASQLILDSVMFLLAREPKENILPEFDLADIPKYFPDYEEIIRKKSID